MSPRAFPMVHGVPAAGHLSGGFWHPGPIDGCVKCEPAPSRRPADCRNCGGDGFTTDAPRCPACRGTGKDTPLRRRDTRHDAVVPSPGQHTRPERSQS